MEAAATGCIFTVDEHQYCAGFGAEAARVILENGALIRKFRDFSIPDCFVENVSGYGELLDKYELSADRLSAGIASMYK
jgi:transketolase C-terminal domain/subunit